MLYTTAHTSPLHSPRANALAGLLLPLGLVLWFRIWRFRLRLYRDMRIIVRTCDRLDQVIAGTQAEAEAEGSGVEMEQQEVAVKHRKLKRVIKVLLLLLILALVGHVVWNGWQRQRHQVRSELPVTSPSLHGSDARPASLHGHTDARPTAPLKLK